MYYDINISLGGKHFFATAERSVTDSYDLSRVLPVLRAKFPEAEGYCISVTRKEDHGLQLGDKALDDLIECARNSRGLPV